MTQTQPISNDIVQLLNEGKVSFSYKTVAGETRNAVGTTNEALMPEGTKIVQPGTSQITYYDLNVNGIRSFSLANLDNGSVEVQS